MEYSLNYAVKIETECFLFVVKKKMDYFAQSKLQSEMGSFSFENFATSYPEMISLIISKIDDAKTFANILRASKLFSSPVTSFLSKEMKEKCIFVATVGDPLLSFQSQTCAIIYSSEKERYEHVRHGYTEYSEGGIVLEKGYYRNDKRHGIFETFKLDGDFDTLITYKNGEEDGYQVVRKCIKLGTGMIQGQITKTICDGLLEGLYYFESFSNLYCTESFFYVRGVKNGPSMVTTLASIKKGDYVDGEKSGLWEIQKPHPHSINNEKVTTKKGCYEKGKKVGFWQVKNFLTGKKIKTGNYINGVKYGIWKHYSNDFPINFCLYTQRSF